MKRKVKVAQWCPCPTLPPHGLFSARLPCPRNPPGQNTGVGCHSLLQGIFSTQESNPGLLHCGQIPYRLSHKHLGEQLSRGSCNHLLEAGSADLQSSESSRNTWMQDQMVFLGSHLKGYRLQGLLLIDFFIFWQKWHCLVITFSQLLLGNYFQPIHLS